MKFVQVVIESQRARDVFLTMRTMRLVSWETNVNVDGQNFAHDGLVLTVSLLIFR